MLSINLQSRIFTEYHAERERTKGGEKLMYFVLLVLLLPVQILIEILKLNK